MPTSVARWANKRKQHVVLFSRSETAQSKEYGEPSQRGEADDYAPAAARSDNPEGYLFAPPRNQKRKQSIGLLLRFWNDVFRTLNVMRTACVMTASPCGVRFARE